MTIKKLSEKELYKNLSDPDWLDLFSFFPEPTCQQMPEYIGLFQEVIFNMYRNFNISIIEISNQGYAEIRFKDSTLGLSFNNSGICTQAFLFDDSEETEGISIFYSANKDAYIN